MVPGPFPPDDDEFDRGVDLRETLRRIPRRTFRAFVAVALLVQGGLFAASLGLMLVAFRGQRTLGGALIGAGLFALVLAFAVYRRRHPTGSQRG